MIQEGSWGLVMMMFCFSEDPVQKILEQMEPPCKITSSNGTIASKAQFTPTSKIHVSCYKKNYLSVSMILVRVALFWRYLP